MTLFINDETREVPDGLALPQLLKQLGLAEKPVVIEHNGEAIPPSQFAGTSLKNKDRLEIITIAAGG